MKKKSAEQKRFGRWSILWNMAFISIFDVHNVEEEEEKEEE